MIDAVPSDDELFDVLQVVIRKRVPEFRVKYKDENRVQKFIGKLAFFNRKYMTDCTTTSKYTVYFPSRKFVAENKIRAFKILAHEYVHVLDRKKHPVLFEILYILPQILFLFSVLAFLSFFCGRWWLMALTSLLALLPWPAFGRAQLEMRGYGMNLAVNIWRHGSISNETREWIVECFTGWTYYGMWPFPDAVDGWISHYEKLIYSIDAIRGEESVFEYSEAYQDVYELLTGIEY